MNRLYTHIKLVSLVFFTIFLSVTRTDVEAASLLFGDDLPSKVGSQHIIPITVDTYGQNIIGTDLVLAYDTRYIEVIQINNGVIFSNASKNIIDNINGIARTSFYNPYGKFFAGVGTLGTITLRTKAETPQTSIGFSFTPNSTTDSNVVGTSGIDHLSLVKPLFISVSDIQISSSSQIDISSNETSNSLTPEDINTPSTFLSSTTDDPQASVLAKEADDFLAPSETPERKFAIPEVSSPRLAQNTYIMLFIFLFALIFIYMTHKLRTIK